MLGRPRVRNSLRTGPGYGTWGPGSSSLPQSGRPRLSTWRLQPIRPANGWRRRPSEGDAEAELIAHRSAKHVGVSSLKRNNFQILGNRDPQVHVHIVARFDPDPSPSMPLPESAWVHSTTLSAEELVDQIGALRTAIASA